MTAIVGTVHLSEVRRVLAELSFLVSSSEQCISNSNCTSYRQCRTRLAGRGSSQTAPSLSFLYASPLVLEFFYCTVACRLLFYCKYSTICVPSLLPFISCTRAAARQPELAGLVHVGGARARAHEDAHHRVHRAAQSRARITSPSLTLISVSKSNAPVVYLVRVYGTTGTRTRYYTKYL